MMDINDLCWTFGRHGVSSQLIVEENQQGVMPASAPASQTIVALPQHPAHGYVAPNKQNIVELKQ